MVNQQSNDNKYIIINNYNTLNVSRLNAPIKDMEWLKGYKKKTRVHAAYKRLTSDLKTHGN